MEKKPKTEEFSLSNKQWEFLDDETLLIILERSDKLAANSFELLQKSTDRAHTLFGYLLTIFSGLTAYLLACDNAALLLPGVVLWAGIGIAVGFMFAKVVWVFPFMHHGSQPRYMITDKLLDAYTSNEGYRHMLLVYGIETNQLCYDINADVLRRRVRVIRLVLNIIKVTLVLVTFISIAIFLSDF